MSHTLKKLKQSEIDRGLRMGGSEKKPKSFQGLSIVFFVVILSSILVVINLRKESLPEQASLQKKVVASVLRDTSVLAKKKERSQNIEIIKPLETAQVDLTEQEQVSFFMKNSHRIESEMITNVGLVAEKKVSKKELKKTVLYDNNQSAFINQEQPTLWKDLDERFKMSMPDMKLNVVSFTEKKKNQYIIMNMKKYQLDEIINKGPSVEEIQKDAVILQYEGKRFMMSLWRKRQRRANPH
jgi:hypothetical protein